MRTELDLHSYYEYFHMIGQRQYLDSLCIPSGVLKVIHWML